MSSMGAVAAWSVQVLETTDEEFEELSKTRRFIFAAQPHGVMSVAGVCVYSTTEVSTTVVCYYICEKQETEAEREGGV
jgi:hypothetical protein